ncbi:MAG: Glycosyl transferase, family 2 [uncultured Solirubrobacteraceae bacterium]|uniref:Glycosyl transferase, family 2 n=1 Tax=uncultured Solirubrobacteraceae bacterium TaxID=1162706 RepID=A0A6J4RYJ2_9ACTN|nr:MAG: Glycosyl transferase, family 2 [uncultured Solirubrobacteraceae bacterium]
MRLVPKVSVLMPVYDQAAFLPRAVASLLAQSEPDWELLVIDDGSTDDPAAALAPFLGDPRIVAHRRQANGGIGAALNAGLAHARGELIAYLPADDVLHADHLESLLALMEDEVALAHTGCEPADEQLQLVQLMHRRTPDRWLEREALESDDLEPLLLERLRGRGRVAGSPRVTSVWTQHPAQRHRRIRESRDGGVNAFRAAYRVAAPLRLLSSETGLLDERARYAAQRGRTPSDRALEGLRILLAGELAFNPDRVLALEERGHELLGLWISDPLGFNSIGPLPFGGIRDLASIADVAAARPDVIYALLNWRAVPLAHALLEARTGVPLVFHFKEAPQRSLARGEWPLLAEVMTRADAVILSSPEERDWFEAALPGRLDPARTLVLDGDLPKRDWLDAVPSERLSATDGRPRTVLLGRPYGFDDALRDGLAARGVELRVHAGRTAVEPRDWVRTLSRYDGGWLHPVRAGNGGDVRRATWDDLNLPARIPTMIAAGLPLILPRNAAGEVHAAQALAESLGAALLYDDLDELADRLRDPAGMAARRAAAWAHREQLTFDSRADELVSFLRTVARR